MIILRRIKNLQRHNLRHDRLPNDLRRIHLRLLRDLLLFLARVQNDRPILRPHIIALTVQRRRIMRIPEQINHIPKRDQSRIIIDANHLSMPRVPIANLLVRRVLHMPARVAAHHLLHPLQHLILGLNTPKTSPAHNRRFQLGSRFISRRDFRGGQAEGSGHGGKQYG